ncbi:NRDE family protein [Microbacterium esteraromaticum]|uniref:NRDE family protein n=1 Tax=Microbacterium esteraromaticum TaxID=57043 RepID=UPI000B363C8C|nr:NRDE family protein [Microbacterium esteraromaticum]
MCTVVIDVAADGVRLLAVRDEDPQRAWDDLGGWWPGAYPGVVGVHDRRAGGAWLAYDPNERRLAVLLNRADVQDLPEERMLSRGSLALESASGRSPAVGQPLPMHGFNLLEVDEAGARVLSWDGVLLRETAVPHGVHMIAHDELDDPRTARIGAWLPRFAASRPEDDGWAARWIDLLAESGSLPPEDDRAIIRDNHAHGYPTMSLLFCVAEVSPAGVQARSHVLPTPGEWG